MENQVAVYSFRGRGVRTVKDENGDLWFVAKDVAERLGVLWNGATSIAHVPEEWRGVLTVNTLSGRQSAITLSEQGLYFFLGRSDKPQALSFQKWIAGEVIPSIRKTGAYNKTPQTYLEALEELVAKTKRLQIAEEKALADAPKVEFFDAVADSADAIDMGCAAKLLNCGIGRNELFELLRNRGVLMDNNIPYQAFIDRGYFRTIEQRYTVQDGSTRIYIKTLVYQRGLAYIRKLVVQSLSDRGLVYVRNPQVPSQSKQEPNNGKDGENED